ncbi:MAG: hypothetical protein WCI29_13815 [Actinomycetes bacterium]
MSGSITRVLTILSGVLVALATWWVIGWLVDRDLHTSGDSAADYLEDHGVADGFAPAALRRRHGWLWWRVGAVFVAADERYWESRFLHRQITLRGARLLDVRPSRAGGWFIRSASGHVRLTFQVGDRQFLMIVPEDQAAWAAAALAPAN